MVISNNAMKETFVVMVRQTTIDIWIWTNLLAVFPPAADATCYQFTIFSAGVEQAVGGLVTCHVIDRDGDALRNNRSLQPVGTVLLTAVAGTVKWVVYLGVDRRFPFYLRALVLLYGRQQ